ncbi:Farnesyl pyrophosphate synthetase [Ascosphaera acerosa]|nr:Farnesyl pyrophosphate synthetase [Ascosphaera acerosa]
MASSSTSSPPAPAAPVKTSRADFEALFPEIVQELSERCARLYKLPENAREWFENSLNANTPGGKLNRGLSVPDAGSVLLGRPLDAKEFRDMCTLGWLIELLQAFFLVADDIMDSSVTRRGEQCWYRRDGVGMVAINDACMLESSIFVLLRERFRAHPSYIDLVELFHEVIYKTEMGQLCDLITAPEDSVDLAKFSMDKFRFIVVYKTAYYSFYLPIALALHYLGLATESNLKQAEEILVPLGEYFQAQDDFLDVYGSPEQIGKVGTDIQDNKCSWVINTALGKASAEQRATLDAAYGRKDKAKEEQVKAVFRELQIEAEYRRYEEARVQHIRSLIDKVDESQGLKKQIFSDFVEKIYKRDK